MPALLDLGNTNMPSFDVVSEVNQHEAANALDQAQREIGTRFDFKGVNARFEQKENDILMFAENEFQLNQMLDILKLKLSKRNIDIQCLEEHKLELALHEARQKITLRQGLETELSKKIIKQLKDNKFKAQAAIQGEKLRITGKSRDELQTVIAYLKQQDWGMPLQYNNFRD
jgi:uncharacterized protein YajQ (UPF0234 family)